MNEALNQMRQYAWISFAAGSLSAPDPGRHITETADAMLAAFDQRWPGNSSPILAGVDSRKYPDTLPFTVEVKSACCPEWRQWSKHSSYDAAETFRKEALTLGYDRTRIVCTPCP